MPSRIFSVVSTVLNMVTPRPKTPKCFSQAISFWASEVKSTSSRKTLIRGSTISNDGGDDDDAFGDDASSSGSLVFESSSAILSTTKSLKRTSRNFLNKNCQACSVQVLSSFLIFKTACGNLPKVKAICLHKSLIQGPQTLVEQYKILARNYVRWKLLKKSFQGTECLRGRKDLNLTWQTKAERRKDFLPIWKLAEGESLRSLPAVAPHHESDTLKKNWENLTAAGLIYTYRETCREIWQLSEILYSNNLTIYALNNAPSRRTNS